MSFQPIKTALKYVSAWSVVAAFAALLTIIFNFLGALFCAALAGMMMGATKASWWLSLPFSLLCPGVLLAVMRAQKTELADRQITALLIICLAVFWTIYLLSKAVMAHEQKTAATNGETTAPLKAESHAGSAQFANGSIAKAPPCNGKEVPMPVGPLELGQLEGRWSCEDSGLDGHTKKRLLQIKDGALVLSTLDAEGHLCACTQARFKWIDCREPRLLAVSSVADDATFTSPSI